MPGTNSTIVGWQSGGGGETRGTWDIAKICLVTIFACTWSILRRPVPDARAGAARTLADKLVWTGLAILLPELILSEALSTWTSAMHALRDYSGFYAVATENPSKSEREHPPVPLCVSRTSLRLAFPFDKMTREIVERNAARKPSTHDARHVEEAKTVRDAGSAGEDQQQLKQEQQQLQQQHQQKLQVSERTVPEGEDEGEDEDESLSTDLTLVHAYMLLDKGVVFHSPSRPERLVSLPDGDAGRKIIPVWRFVRIRLADIQDKSKADAFARLTALVQLLTLIASSATRWATRTAVSPLEVATIFFALQAILVYAVNWRRPQGVGSPLRVELTEDAFDGLRRHLEVADAERDESRMRALLPRQRIPGESISNMNTRFENASHQGLLVALTNLLFGAVHFAEWNYPFPTVYETWLWRAGSIATVGLPLLAYVGWRVMVDLLDSRDEYSPKFRPLGRWQFPAALMAVYAAARLAIIGVAFSSLRRAPADLYVADWSQNLPAVS